MDKTGRTSILRFRTERDSRVTQLLLYLSFVSIFDPVTCQEVNAFIGDTVLLPCLHKEAMGGDETIYWLDENDKQVIYFPRNAIPVPKHPRVVSFPEPYETKNFSILMKDVKQSDSGLYACRFSRIRQPLSRINLTVTGERPRTTITPSGSDSVAVVTPNTFIMLFSLSVITLLTGRT